MMSFIREEYASASDWLSALKKGEEWTLYLKKLQHAAPGDMSRLRGDAMRRIGKGKTFEYWDIFSHNVELTVEKVWRIAELTLPKLEIQTVGMLSIEWLDQHSSGNQVSNIREPSPDVVNQLKPIFYGSEEEVKAFLVSIQGMKPTQITDKVNQLVSEKKISDMSKHRDLWKVLHDCGIYERSESNWNQQVK